ncbi:DUF4236 domain-containing protein [Candidatus Chloroploca sp. M-50]|uniref:DUF4236 domain-containing protein n=1 Tax=Candidatus Chloroploca mongolica TaxID=2528176 RepID=A0ABS4DGP9_9CHLR|nr:DUF4236 domain-containing protein [Candidatus Chloroploca mongolica]MBP1468622.1 DUF4236 domain-containing protein [Candidatus Chloroploca mongolica]
MSFYIRKSVKFGSIRLNFSKSGIGISAGVKGARISTSPRGTYIHMGRNGIYYRQKIDGSIVGTRPTPQTDSGTNFGTSGGNIPSANVSDLVESSNKDLLAQINSRIQEPTYAFIVGIISTAIAGAIASLAYLVQSNASTILESAYPILLALPLVIAAIVWIMGLSVAWVTHQQEKLARTTTLQYKLDEGAKGKFIALQNARADLAKSVCIWRVVSQTPNWDWKRNAGASSIITRKRISARYAHPPFIETRIKVYGILLDSMQLFFLPDQVLIFQGGKYGAVSYDALQVHALPTSFIEYEGVPSDSTVVGYTWQYVRKDGGPDLRFSDNRQIPIAQYGYIELSSQSGLNLHLHVSSLSYAQRFAQALSDYIQHCQEPHRTSSGKTSSGYQQSSGYQRQEQSETEAPKEPRDESPYTILGVSPTASKDEIIAAYRKLAQMYHPDKVAGLAPEFGELAEKRMKAINAAYEQLKRTFKE